jgi:hypothetical protein
LNWVIYAGTFTECNFAGKKPIAFHICKCVSRAKIEGLSNVIFSPYFWTVPETSTDFKNHDFSVNFILLLLDGRNGTALSF